MGQTDCPENQKMSSLGSTNLREKASLTKKLTVGGFTWKVSEAILRPSYLTQMETINEKHPQVSTPSLHSTAGLPAGILSCFNTTQATSPK